MLLLVPSHEKWRINYYMPNWSIYIVLLSSLCTNLNRTISAFRYWRLAKWFLASYECHPNQLCDLVGFGRRVVYNRKSNGHKNRHSGVLNQWFSMEPCTPKCAPRQRLYSKCQSTLEGLKENCREKESAHARQLWKLCRSFLDST